jgi:hypothetical protein
MLKKVALVAAAFALVCAVPAAYADGSDENPWQDTAAGAASGDKSGNYTYKTDHQQPYIHDDGARVVNAPYRKTAETRKVNLMQGAGSQTSMGGPLIFYGRNTFIAPQNLALQTEKGSVFGGRLPETHLDSLVFHNATPFQTFGDEGTDGPPPLGSFSTIESSVQHATTGHKSDAPSAWY